MCVNVASLGKAINTNVSATWLGETAGRDLRYKVSYTYVCDGLYFILDRVY